MFVLLENNILVKDSILDGLIWVTYMSQLMQVSYWAHAYIDMLF